MKLTKEPETEQEYWETIESLGGMVWRLNHDLADGRISDPDNAVAKDIEEGQAILTRLVVGIAEKFNVIRQDHPPKTDGKYPDPPEGKRWYWSWYEEMKEKFLEAEYGKIICSACPLSKGLDSSFMYQIPCSVWPGMLYQLDHPAKCSMVDPSLWSRRKLLREIRVVAGSEGSRKFREKEKTLLLG